MSGSNAPIKNGAKDTKITTTPLDQKEQQPLEPQPPAEPSPTNQQQMPGTYVSRRVTELRAVRDAGPLTTATFPPLGEPMATKNDLCCAIHDALSNSHVTVPLWPLLGEEGNIDYQASKEDLLEEQDNLLDKLRMRLEAGTHAWTAKLKR